MYLPRHFSVQELVPEPVYVVRGDKAIELIDARLLITIDELRDELGPCTINDWAWEGAYTQSGLRTNESGHYSPFSQHTFGRAADLKFENYSAPEVQEFILNNHERFRHLTFLELNTPTWTHIDVRNCKKLTTWRLAADGGE